VHSTICHMQTRESTCQMSIRSYEMASIFTPSPSSQVFTLIAGDFVQLDVDGQQHGLEPLRPLKFETANPVEASQPTEELLIVHVAATPQQVRPTVRIVELSKKREQHLFDGQLSVLEIGRAHV